MKTNIEFKSIALNALRGNWGKAVIATLIFALIISFISGPAAYSSIQLQNEMSALRTVGTISPADMLAIQQSASHTSGLTSLLQFLILMPISIGFANAFKRLVVHGDNQILVNTFHIGFTNYWRNVWSMLLVSIFTVLWSLLFIIPGIIKLFSYAMTPYIIVDNPELTANEAIDRSRMMMRGHKFDLFWLYLGFIGWFFLCILTCGIGFLWLTPYVEAAKAAFYEEVKADYAIHGGLI